MLDETKLLFFYDYCIKYKYIELYNKQYEQIPFSILLELKRDMKILRETSVNPTVKYISRNFFYNALHCRKAITVQCETCKRKFDASLKALYNHYRTGIYCIDTYCMEADHYKHFVESNEYVQLKRAMTNKCKYSPNCFPEKIPICYSYGNGYKVFKLTKGLIQYIKRYLNNRPTFKLYSTNYTNNEFLAKEFEYGSIPVRFELIGDYNYDSDEEREFYSKEHKIVRLLAAFDIEMFQELADTMSLFCDRPVFQKVYHQYKREIWVEPEHSTFIDKKNIYKYNVARLENLYHIYSVEMITQEMIEIKRAIKQIPLCCDDMNYMVYSFLYKDDYFNDNMVFKMVDYESLREDSDMETESSAESVMDLESEMNEVD